MDDDTKTSAKKSEGRFHFGLGGHTNELPAPAPREVEAEPAPEALRTPEQWAEKLRHINRADPRLPQSKTHPDWMHAAANKLHGWERHAYHYPQDPLLITQGDYERALENAAEYPLKPAHEPALSLLMRPKEKV